MALSNTATPKYYGQFRDAVIRGDIPVCKEIAMEMNRIDELIANPGIYYDEDAVEGFIKYCLVVNRFFIDLFMYRPPWPFSFGTYTLLSTK